MKEGGSVMATRPGTVNALRSRFSRPQTGAAPEEDEE